MTAQRPAGPAVAPALTLPLPRLRIAVLNRNFDPAGGGAERYSIALVEHLAARHDLHVFAQTIRHQWPGVVYHAVPVLFRRPRWINQLWFAWATARATRQGFDLVHSHENTWHGQIQTIHVLPIRYKLFIGLAGAPRVLRWIKVLTSPRLLAYLWLEKARYRQTPGKALVVTSASLQEVMVKTHPGVRTLLHLLTPGVNAVTGRASDAEKIQARRQLGLPLAAPLVLFVGNDYRKKGLPTLVAALASMPAEVQLVVVGNGAHAAAFSADVAALGLNGRVHFLGSLPDVTPAYVAADVLAHPTLEDTFAMVVLEAMSHGLPVVVSAARYCGISALLTHGANAMLLDEPQNPVVVANALQSILSSPQVSAAMSDAATEFAGQHSWTDVARRQDELYALAMQLKNDSEANINIFN